MLNFILTQVLFYINFVFHAAATVREFQVTQSGARVNDWSTGRHFLELYLKHPCWKHD